MSLGRKIEQILKKYYEINMIRLVNFGLYFVVQIALFFFLTILPIKLAFNWLLRDISNLDQIIDICILVIFGLHIYLYFDVKLKYLVQNPEKKKKLLFQAKAVRIKWLSLLTWQLLIDLICFVLAVAEVILNDNSQVSRILQAVYLVKIYKIKVFHDRFMEYLIGTVFYTIYNVFYGLFVLIIIVSYVGCAFYYLDRQLLLQGYKYVDLLWIVSSAWDNIIEDSFNIQLLYTIYWSLGTASGAAYGNVAASSPPDVTFNIICLYFEGFLFGFYLSRIHTIPDEISRSQNELLELFDQFQKHNNQIQQGIQQKLYFQILCSLEYRLAKKKTVQKIQSAIPQNSMIEVKMSIYQGFLSNNIANLMTKFELQKKLSLKISQVVTESGELLFDYEQVKFDSLFYLKEGQIEVNLHLDNSNFQTRTYRQDEIFGLFSFITKLRILPLVAKCNKYCSIYYIERNQYRQCLNIDEQIQFDNLFLKTISFEQRLAMDQVLGLYNHHLIINKSSALFLNPQRNASFISDILDKKKQNTQTRTMIDRGSLKSQKFARNKYGLHSIGIQCNIQIKAQTQLERVLIQ